MDLEIWDPEKSQHKSSQNTNPCHPKCRQGPDWPEKNLPGPIWGHFKPILQWTEEIQKMLRNNCLSPMDFSPGALWPFNPLCPETPPPTLSCFVKTLVITMTPASDPKPEEWGPLAHQEK